MSISLDITETIIQLETSSGVSIELVAGAVVVVPSSGGSDSSSVSAISSGLSITNSAVSVISSGLSDTNTAVSAISSSLSDTDATVSTIVSALGDKADLVGGLVPASQLPSFLDDVLEGTYVNTTIFNDEDGNPYTPESNKVYIDTTFNKSYRWSGSLYAPLDEGVVLGETSSNAYRGDRGKIAYDFSQNAIPIFSSISSGLSDTNTAVSTISSGLSNTNSSVSTISSGLSNLASVVSSISSGVGGLTFNQSRWIFNDFDSGIAATVAMYGGYLVASIGSGTRVGIAGGVGTQGILRFISAAGANTGYVVSNASAVPNMHIRPLQGSCCLFVAALPSGGISRLLTIGFDATVNWSVATMPTNSVHARFTVSSSTVSASCRRSVVGTTTTQGSTVLTDDVYHVFLVQYVTDDQVRFVIWNLLTNVKVFDETIVTDTPTTATGAILFHGVHATGSGTQPLVDIDYIGRGIELPPYVVIPT